MAREVIRMGMKLLAMAVFMGYMVLWVMIPTNTYYLHWFPTVKSRANSTFFGEQGGGLLIYMFPILFIAALGCFYLHLGKTVSQHSDGEGRIVRVPECWKHPVIVKGPLGIVSWIELSFLVMFGTLLVWSFGSYIHSMFPYAPYEAAQHGEKIWEAKLESSALLLGLVGNICLSFLFFPVTRGSSVLRLIGLTSEASIKYHIWLGHTSMTLFTAHGVCYIFFWAKTRQISQMLKWEKVGISNVAGEICLLSGLLMWATTLPKIRRKLFELFFYTHHLYILFVVFFVLHVGFATACIMLPGVYLFVIDRYLRFLQSRQKIRVASARLLPCKAVELNFSKNPGLSYTPTSIVFVNVPTISRLQWHPFTVTSSSNAEDDTLSVLIKSGGSWSSSLYERLASGSVKERLEVSLEGPYGPASTNFHTHDMLVMICGGSGITPLISITRELLFRANTSTEKTPRVLLVCAFKTSLDLSMLDILLPLSLDVSRLQLQIEAYVTRENDEPKGVEQHPIRTLRFKPGTTDVSVSAALGSNSWLWLGLIIASSFVMFLLFIGVITRYYMYPKEHDSHDAYPDSSRSALYLMFLCVAIASTATAAFLWNKRRNETGHIQNMATPPMASPDLIPSDAAVELESFPRQTLSQATTVHHGKRPNLKKILHDCRGTSIGVLVSGPRKMRQEAAAICCSGLADNLHFESISFSW